MPIFFAMLLMLVSGLSYRTRGSEFLADFHGGRISKLLIGAAPRGILVAAVSTWYVGLAAWVLCTAADSAGHAQGQSFGSPGDNDFYQAFKLAVAGTISTAPVFIAMLMLPLWRGLPAPYLIASALLGGLLEPLAYWLGWRTPSFGKQGDPWYFRLLRGTEWAEVYVGICFCLPALAM
jgi:hypothetical protein